MCQREIKLCKRTANVIKGTLILFEEGANLVDYLFYSVQ